MKAKHYLDDNPITNFTVAKEATHLNREKGKAICEKHARREQEAQRGEIRIVTITRQAYKNLILKRYQLN